MSFPRILAAQSEEQGEGYYQDIKMVEKRSQGRWNCNMMADYCRNLIRDVPYEVDERSDTKRKFMMS